MHINELAKLPRSVRVMQNRINNLFDSFFSNHSNCNDLCEYAHFPSMDMSEDDKSFTIKFELPFINESDIKIKVDKNTLFVEGEKKTEKENKSANYHIKEIKTGKFSRTVDLPYEIDASKATANFNDGILEISISKPQNKISETKTIPISSKNQ